MKKRGLIILLFLFFSITLLAEEYFPISNIKEGMILTGKTALKGEKLSEFKVKVSGILENVYPGQSFVIGEILGDYYKETGVIAGMSGSPVYYDGKIVGAVSFSFSFTKRAIAGITPYEEMKRIEKKSAPQVHIDIDFKSAFGKKIYNSLFKILKSKINTNMNYKLPLRLSGFNYTFVNKISKDFSALNMMAVPAGRGKIKIPEKINIDNVSLKDGDPINVHLAIGDLDISAGGTVTRVVGNRFYAFGHPFFNLGKVAFPVSKASIIDVVPNYQSSFKLSSIVQYVGKITEDRTSGIKGEIGSFPELIPIKVTMNYLKPVEFEVKIVKDKLLTPLLVYNVIANIISTEAKAYGELSLKVSGAVYLKNGKSVRYDDVFSDQNSGGNLSMMYASLTYILIDNPIKNFEIDSIKLEITPFEKNRVARLKRVIASKYRAKPGENISFTLYYKPSEGKMKKENISVPVPPLKKGSKLYILIGDSKTLQKFETQTYKDGFRFPSDEASLMRALNNIRKNNIIYFKVLTLKKSVFINGYDYSGIPPSFFSFILPAQKDYNYTYPKVTTFKDYALPIDYKFEGSALIKLEIE
jgi:hypothetical protein